MDLGKVENLWEGYTILDAIKNIRDSWEKNKISMLIEVWKKCIPGLMNDFEGFKTSSEEAPADVVEIAEKQSLKIWLKCCNLMIKL